MAATPKELPLSPPQSGGELTPERASDPNVYVPVFLPNGVENIKVPGEYEYEYGAGPSSMVNSLYSASLATVLTDG
jgi:hypothetical protein